MLAVVRRAGVVSRLAEIAFAAVPLIGHVEGVDGFRRDAAATTEPHLDQLVEGDEELVLRIAPLRHRDGQAPVGLEPPVARGRIAVLSGAIRITSSSSPSTSWSRCGS